MLLPTKNDVLTIVKIGTGAYCLSAHNLLTPVSHTWYYDSQAGGIQPTGSAGCPISTTGVAGSSRTG